jgi:ABC-2 type transport system ATP-binding protein
VRRKDRVLLVTLAGDSTFDTIRDAVADLDLSLHRLEQHRHQVADLFREEVSHA